MKVKRVIIVSIKTRQATCLLCTSSTQKKREKIWLFKVAIRFLMVVQRPSISRLLYSLMAAGTKDLLKLSVRLWPTKMSWRGWLIMPDKLHCAACASLHHMPQWVQTPPSTEPAFFTHLLSCTATSTDHSMKHNTCYRRLVEHITVHVKRPSKINPSTGI